METWLVLAFLKGLWTNIVKYWRISVGVIFAVIVYVLGVKKGRLNLKQEKNKRKLAESDLQIHKETFKKKDELEQASRAELLKKQKELDAEKRDQLAKAKLESDNFRNEINNNNEKLDNILINEFNLKKEKN